jgi:hypothetical protein
MIHAKAVASLALAATLATGTTTTSCQPIDNATPAAHTQSVASSDCLTPGAAPGTYGGPIEVSQSTGYSGKPDWVGTCDHCGNVLSYTPHTTSVKRQIQRSCGESADFESRLNK